MVNIVEVAEIADEDMVDVLTVMSLIVLHAVNFCVFQGQVAVEHLMAQVKHSSSHADLAVQVIGWPRVGLVKRKSRQFAVFNVAVEIAAVLVVVLRRWRQIVLVIACQ